MQYISLTYTERTVADGGEINGWMTKNIKQRNDTKNNRLTLKTVYNLGRFFFFIVFTQYIL